MTQDFQGPTTMSVFRIDKFVVPPESETAFMERVRRIQLTLDSLPGRMQNLVLTQIGDKDLVNVVTIVEWESSVAMAAAAVIAKAKYAEENFDPQSFMRKLGVQPNFGLYVKA
jgi:heme-degrading monooxygenase HmoA